MLDLNLFKSFNIIDKFSSKESLIQTGESGYLQNCQALEQLKIEQGVWEDILKVSGIFSAGSLLIPLPLISLFGGAATAAALEFYLAIGRLASVTEMLLKHFGEQNITITPRVKTEEGIIDLLVKFPDRRIFAFMLKSKGTAFVKWREERQHFFISNRKKGGKRITRDPELIKLSSKLNRMSLALKKEKNPLKGLSNTELNKITIKAIVLTGETKVDPNNDPALFVDFGRARVLRVQAESSIYVLNQDDDLINFLMPTEKK
jgi:hypothetical protein